MTIHLRPATPNDAKDIAQILSDWIDATPWMPRIHTRTEDQGFGAFLIEKTDVTIAEDAGRTLGFAAMQGDELQALYLDAGARRCGLGSTMVNQLKANHDALHLWCFQANGLAQKFYLKHGFTEVGRTDGQANDEKLPDMRYSWHKENQADG